jgi:hypothetical protein
MNWADHVVRTWKENEYGILDWNHDEVRIKASSCMGSDIKLHLKKLGYELTSFVSKRSLVAFSLHHNETIEIHKIEIVP